MIAFLTSFAAHFAGLFQHYGLAAVFVLLLLENFGLPLPGETVLLYAGYHMRVYAGWGWVELLLAATSACVLGQAAGYVLGRYFAAWARRGLRLTGRHHARATIYFRQHGPATILFARFVAGVRFLAGPIAGLYHMPWRTFLIFNLVGAVAWVALIGEAGVLLGVHGRQLTSLLGRAEVLALLIAVVLVAIAWRRLHEGGHEGGWDE